MKVELIVPQKAEINVSGLPLYAHSTYELKPFDERTIEFFDTFSKAILNNKSINRFAEIVALAFWIRKSNLNKIKNENQYLLENPLYTTAPIGKVFHVCPANVDTMFIYSLAVSVLMGNKNLLRVSKRMNSVRIDSLFEILNEIVSTDKFKVFSEYINIISYEHSNEISTYVSGNANARVIWGGDATVERFKSFKAAPRTKDIIFADRISVLCINCKAYLGLDETSKKDFLKQFFNDAYTFDQMGCSSPQSIYLVGTDDEYKNCVTLLSTDLSIYVAGKYETDIASIASLKLNKMVDDVIDEKIDNRIGDNYITFVEVKNNTTKDLNHSCGGGYFYVHHITDVKMISTIVSAKLQTISYFGLNTKEIDELKHLANGEGIDRIVTLGKALDFYYIWDGYNLLDELSRKVFVN